MQPTIALGREAGPLEVAAARMLADRASMRLGHQIPVTYDDASEATVVMGTPSSSATVADALASAGVVLPASAESFAMLPGVPLVLAAREPGGLVFAAGRLLFDSTFENGSWKLPDRATVAAPEKQLRPIYFATHFGNWYCHATDEELESYIEDLALYGYNALVTWFDMHHYRGFDDGAHVWDRLAKLDRIARGVGMKTIRIAIANESFEGQAPPEWRATGRLAGTGYQTDLCPSIPEARALIVANRRAFLERMRDTTSVDAICYWPYDQGGCNCERCAPWPTTYFDLCSELAAATADALPGAEVILSAWWIGTHVAGEDEPFFECLDRREGWFDTVMAGTVELRRWLADGRKIPDQYGVLLFPEISMFDALPWGGRGANPAPRKFAQEMAELGPHIAGAMPYSEGRYEDLNKFLWAQMQWDSSRDVAEIVRDYCRLSFGATTAAEASELVLAVEAGLRDLPTAGRRYEAAKGLEAAMPDWAREGWRWQVLGARVAIDAMRYELENSTTPEERRSEVNTELREIYERLQHEIYRHDESRSLRDWIYLPYDVWLTLPLNELRLPTGV